MTRYSPQQLIEKYRGIAKETPTREFFRNPRHKKTQEIWCAAHFSLGFDKFIGDCAVLISDRDEQTDTDFVLEYEGVQFPFQITEIQEPGRRRGDEYRDTDRPAPRPYNPDPGTEQGSSWVRAAIEKKLLKNYAAASELNLLCYLNFTAQAQQFEDVRAACDEVSAKFASVWLLNGNAMCCIRPIIPDVRGWLVIPETPSHVES